MTASNGPWTGTLFTSKRLALWRRCYQSKRKLTHLGEAISTLRKCWYGDPPDTESARTLTSDFPASRTVRTGLSFDAQPAEFVVTAPAKQARPPASRTGTPTPWAPQRKVKPPTSRRPVSDVNRTQRQHPSNTYVGCDYVTGCHSLALVTPNSSHEKVPRGAVGTAVVCGR